MNLLGRIFGPSLGVRLGEDEPAGPNGEPGRTTELVEFRLVAAPLFMGAGALGVVGTAITVAFADPMVGFRPGARHGHRAERVPPRRRPGPRRPSRSARG